MLTTHKDAGYVKLIEAVIWECFTSPRRFSNPYPQQTRKTRIEFAKNSPLINMWCDIVDYDEPRVRQAIININTMAQDKDFDTLETVAEIEERHNSLKYFLDKYAKNENNNSGSANTSTKT